MLSFSLWLGRASDVQLTAEARTLKRQSLHPNRVNRKSWTAVRTLTKWMDAAALIVDASDTNHYADRRKFEL